MNKENKLKHYWDCASALEPATHTHKLLKSYYMTQCRKLAKANVKMPQEKFSRNTMCRRCSSKWNETDFRMKLNPQEITNSTKVKQLVAKLYNGKNSLTKKQLKRAKWLRKRVRHSMEMQCEFCQHKTSIGMHKLRGKEREVSKAETVDLVEQKEVAKVADASAAVKPKKKKKKNKNKHAGIKVEQVQRVGVDKILPKVEAPLKKSKSAKGNPFKTNAVKQQEVSSSVVKIKPNLSTNKSAEKGAVPNKPPKPVPNLSQPLKAKKKKKKATTATSNTQSKTQQQNSLLQLAALLKAQTKNKSDSKGAQNRLESLLK